MGFLGGGAPPAPTPQVRPPVIVQEDPNKPKRKKGGVRSRISAGRALGKVSGSDVLRKTLGGA